MTLTITLTNSPEPYIKQAILEPRLRLNQQHANWPDDERPLALLHSDPTTAEITGGLWGRTAFAQLHIEILFVPETLRGSGIGRDLIGRAEEEAVRRGCLGAWLDTFSFQARGFYERLGYTVMGAIENYPPGHCRYLLKKALEQRPSAGALVGRGQHV
jgi:GNAT superfamily N-acetyltransferase